MIGSAGVPNLAPVHGREVSEEEELFTLSIQSLTRWMPHTRSASYIGTSNPRTYRHGGPVIRRFSTSTGQAHGTAAGVPGSHNLDGSADYRSWRSSRNRPYTLPLRDNTAATGFEGMLNRTPVPPTCPNPNLPVPSLRDPHRRLTPFCAKPFNEICTASRCRSEPDYYLPGQRSCR